MPKFKGYLKTVSLADGGRVGEEQKITTEETGNRETQGKGWPLRFPVSLCSPVPSVVKNFYSMYLDKS